MEDIAIVGMACIFPGAANLQEYWQNIVNKVDAVSDPPPDWGGDFAFDPSSTENDRIYCKRGGYLGELSRFDPLEHGVMPIAVDGAEPEHFLALQVASEALKDAGVPGIPLNRERTEVILGRGTFVNRGYTTLHQHGLFLEQTLCLLKELSPEYSAEELQELKKRLKAKLPPFSAHTAPGLVSTIMSGRIANRLDLKGTNYTVDAACASSLLAVEQAVQDLRAGKCDTVLAGAVQLTTHHLVLMVFCQLGALSRRYQIRPFDKSADGTLLGEGVGMMVLKRRSDAERDGNRIYALIKAIGSASDGRAKSVIAPRLEGEQLAIQRAYESAGISPSTIGLIEAHGTAMPVGDATEIEALGNVFGPRTGALATCAVGSVKSMIAHLIPASGIAGLIKTALALYHKVLPPTLHCEEPNPALGLEKTPFYVNTETRPWVHGRQDTPRRAGVNAFGFGGINAHAILEEHAADRRSAETLYREWDSELCVFSGASRGDVIDQMRMVQEHLASSPGTALRDIAFSVNSRLDDSGPRLSIVASSLTELERKLSHAVKKLQDPACKRIREKSGIYYAAEPLARQGKLAYLFPGEGSQYLNMFADLCMLFPESRHCFDLLDQAFADRPDRYRPSDVIFPPPAAREEERRAQEDGIWRMEGGIDGVIAADRAMYRILQHLCIRPDAIVGHSSGEFMSLEAAGAVEYRDDSDMIRYIRAGNGVIRQITLSDQIPSLALHAVGGADRTIASRIIAGAEGRVFIAMDNCPNQFVVCGDAEAMAPMLREFQAAGGICQTLPFARPYHSSLFGPAQGFLQDFFDSLKVSPPTVPLYSCMTASVMPPDAEEIRRLAVGQWVNQVRFRDTIEAMYADGVRLFLEVGPRANLTGFVSDTLSGRPFLAVASNVHHRSGITQLHHALGMLAAQGVSLNLEYLYQRRDTMMIDFAGGSSAGAGRAASKKAPHLPLSLPLLGIHTKAFDAPLARGAARADRVLPDSAGVPPSATVGNTEPQNPCPAQVAGQGMPGGVLPVTAQDVMRALRPGIKQTGSLEAYLRTMDQFLDLQQTVMSAYLGHAAVRSLSPASSQGQEAGGVAPVSVAAAASAAKPIVSLQGVDTQAMPFVDAILSHRAGEELTASRVFDLEQDPFLLDHTLGRDLSVYDRTLMGLPLMPLTVSMEILAEAASLLMPAGTLIGMRDIRAHRWIAFEDRRLRIMMRAARRAENEVQVQLWESGDHTAGSAPPPVPAVEGIMVFAENYPEPPSLGSFSLKGKRPSRWTSDALYAEGMFSGPCFRGMASVDSWGEDGGEATLRALPPDGFFRSRSATRFVTDHVLLDAAGQLIAYWIADHRETGFNVYPFRVGAVHFYGPPLTPGDLAKCRARISPLAENQLRSTIDIIGPRGGLHIQLVDWDDRSFDLPRSFYQIRFRPREERLSTAWPEPAAALPDPGSLRCSIMRDFPDRLLHAHGLVWLRVLAHLALSRREREAWRTMQASHDRRVEWLLARIAAKDAVRSILADRYGMSLCLPDVEIGADSYGRPLVQGAWTRDVAGVPSLSLTHKKGTGAALASAQGDGCGLDLEILGERTGETARRVLLESELACLGPGMASADDGWPLRVWCAKEAIGKALGRGLHGKVGNLLLRGVDASSGMVTMQAADGLLREFPGLQGKDLQAYTMREGMLIIASAVHRAANQE